MRRAIAAIVALVSPAAAEDEREVESAPQRITARLDGDTARFTARFVIASDNGSLSYKLPDQALVTSAAVIEHGRRRTLELTPAQTASEAFDALWEKPAGAAPTRAVLVSADAYREDITISIASPKKTHVVVDAEIAAPTCYLRDARYVAVPDAWIAKLPAEHRVADAGAVAEACADHTGQNGAWMKFPARQLAARRAGADRIGTYAGRVALGTKQFVKLEVNLAGRLSEVPRDLATAIVVDASRSMSVAELEAQRSAIAAYLRAVPNSRVQVIAHARHARALLPGWMDATQAAPRVERALQALRPANGSAVDAGVREAARWLAQLRGTHRIVLFTDENLSMRSEHTRAIDDAIPPNTLVHVVALGGDGFERDDGVKLARLAEVTRGLAVRGGAKPEDGTLDATLLARPITLDHVVVRSAGFTTLDTGTRCADETDERGSLAEGAACTWWGEGTRASTPIVVEGFLWNEPVQRLLRPDASRSLDVVRELSMMHVLDDELSLLAKRAARAVNEVWSLYLTWGGTDGYEPEGVIGYSTYGSTCSSRCMGAPSGFGFGHGTRGVRADLETTFARVVEAACKPTQAITVEVETTFDEVVDVVADGADATLRTCATEALWAAWLAIPGVPAHAVTSVRVGPIKI